MYAAWLAPLALGMAAMAAGPAASDQQQPAQPTFRTSTNLVVIDAVVTDSEGRHIRDLTAADFEVVQSGRRMPVRQALYVETGPAAPTAATTPVAEPMPSAPPAPARPPRTLSDAKVAPDSRVIAIVVDDLGLSFESIYFARRALTKFVDEQMRPGDLVAILRASTGAGALQQFTTDKRLLHAAIDRVRWTILSRSGISAFTPVSKPDATGVPALSGSGTAEDDDEDIIGGLRTTMLAGGSLGALEYVIRGVESLPGRKSVIFMSEGMRLIERPNGLNTGGAGRVYRAFTRVMDRANRAGVVVYTMDPRGLATGGLTAEDDPQPAPPLPGPPGTGASLSAAAQQAVLDSAEDRRAFLLDSQESLTYIAEQTGGFAVLNTNDLNLGFRRVLDDLAGYYLIGYEGEPDSLRAWDPGRVRIRVKRPGLRVRARKGLFGPSDVERPSEGTSGDPLVLATLSPFSATGLDVRVTALFGHDGGKESFLRSLFFIDPAGIEFVRQADGKHSAQLTIALLTMDGDGRPSTQWRRLVDLELTPETYQMVRQQGILYSARIPIKSPGAYQLRAAVRHESADKLGSSSQFVEVPRVGKGRVALSGIVMHGAGAPKPQETPADVAVPAALEPAVFGAPWVRIFNTGSDALYTYEIYDGVTDGSNELSTVAILLRDGKPVSLADRKGPVHITAEEIQRHSDRPVTGPWTQAEKRCALLLATVVTLWCSEPLHQVSPAMVALIGAVVAASPALGTVRLKDALKTVPWSLLLFKAATIAMGVALAESGAAKWLVGGLPAGITPVMFLAVVIAVSTAAHLILQSRSARSSVLVPLVVAAAVGAGVNPVAAAHASTAAAGVCHTLPASAKPVTLFAEIPGTPTYTPRDLLRLSAVLAPLTAALVLLFAVAVWPLLGVPVTR